MSLGRASQTPRPGRKVGIWGMGVGRAQLPFPGVAAGCVSILNQMCIHLSIHTLSQLRLHHHHHHPTPGSSQGVLPKPHLPATCTLGPRAWALQLKNFPALAGMDAGRGRGAAPGSRAERGQGRTLHPPPKRAWRPTGREEGDREKRQSRSARLGGEKPRGKSLWQRTGTETDTRPEPGKRPPD